MPVGNCTRIASSFILANYFKLPKLPNSNKILSSLSITCSCPLQFDVHVFLLEIDMFTLTL